MKSRLNRASTDRLKRVQEISCFDSPLGGPTLRIGNPVAALVKCDKHIFLAVGQVNQIELGGRKDLLGIRVEILRQTTAKISFQIGRLLPATRDDDPACLIQPLNPAISTRTPGKPAYLFDSRFLVTEAAALYDGTPKQLLRAVPDVKRTLYFPYRSNGKA